MTFEDKMKIFATILTILAFSVGCATHHTDDDIWGIYAYDGPWNVEIWQPEGYAIIPRAEWNKEEIGFFGTADFQERLPELESGTRWIIDNNMWILWSWDWTNHTVMITRNELDESVEQAVPAYGAQSAPSAEP